jgi:predicted RND superfamily exporter protein
MWKKIADFILRNRFFILGLITLITVFFAYYAITGLKLENKYGIVLPKNSPTTENYKKFKALFGEDGGALIIGIQTDSLYTEDNFLKWKELGDSILQFDGVESVVSEATLFSIRNDTSAAKFEINRIFSDITYQEKSIDSIRREIKQNPLYKGLLYSEKGNVSLMMVVVDETFLSDKTKMNVVLDIEKLSQKYEGNFGKIHFAGLPHLRVQISKRILGEMIFFVGLSLLVTSCLLFLFFRSFRVVLICLIVVCIAVIWSLGSVAFLEFRLSSLMALLPALMIVIGVPNCIFLMTKFHQEMKEHGNKVKALSLVIQKIGTATFLTNFTTAIGFLTFAFTNSNHLMQFGIVASTNIMMVFLLSLCILPILTSFFNPPKARHLKHLDRKFAVGMLNFIVEIVQKRRKLIYFVSLIIVLISLYGLTKIKLTGNITSDLPKEDSIYKDVKFMEKHFGGAIPFEMLISYKESGRLMTKSTLTKVAEIQALLQNDSLFSRSISPVDFVKLINMSYYGNNPDKYTLIANRDRLRLKKYVDNLAVSNINGGGFSLKDLVDTTTCTIRIRCQMKDIGSIEVYNKVNSLKVQVDEILNPTKKEIERFYKISKTSKQKKRSNYIDSIFDANSSIASGVGAIYAQKYPKLETQFSNNPDFIRRYYSEKDFLPNLRKAINREYFDVIYTGVSVVASDGTRYLVNNLISSLIFAIICIGVLMALLFRSWRMVLISMIPNIIPLIVTAGIMGFFGIPLKASTLLIFSIAFGISIDDTIHFLSKYRQELKNKHWDLKSCVLIAIRESGLGMFYTSIVLFCGFSVFAFSQFGGTQALGILISITLLVAMVNNLVLLPALLLSMDKLITTKSFKEPYFEAYNEDSDIDWNSLPISEENDKKIES